MTIKRKMKKQTANKLLCLLLFALSVFSLARGGFNPFIYFQF